MRWSHLSALVVVACSIELAPLESERATGGAGGSSGSKWGKGGSSAGGQDASSGSGGVGGLSSGGTGGAAVGGTSGSAAGTSGTSGFGGSSGVGGVGGVGGGGVGGGSGGVGGGSGGAGGLACFDLSKIDVSGDGVPGDCFYGDQQACVCEGCDEPTCTLYTDCVCPVCWYDVGCDNPDHCFNDGLCDPWSEGCVCWDCADHFLCL